MELEQKRKLSLIFIIIAAVLIALGVTGVILGAVLAVSYNTILFWISLAGILPLSIIMGLISFILDRSYRKEKNE